MATRKRGKSTTRRRSKAPMINVLNLAEAMVVGSAVTQGLFGTRLVPFLTEGWLRPKTPGAQMGAGNSWTISLSEFFEQGMGMSQDWQNRGGLSASMKKNLQDNGGRMVATLILAPMAFRAGRKLASKPINMVNKFIKPATGNLLKI